MPKICSFSKVVACGIGLFLVSHNAFGVNLPACTSMAGSNELCVVTTGKLTNPVGPDPLALAGSIITTVTGTLSATGAAWTSGWSVLGAPVNPGSSQTYSGVPLTLATVASQLTVSCKGGATVDLNATSGGDSLNVTSCSLYAGTLSVGTVTTSITLPANTLAQAIPQRFAAVAIVANSTATYVCTLGPPLCGSTDPTTLTLSNGTLSATCVGCAGMSLTPPSPGPLMFTAQQGGSAPESQMVTVTDSPITAVSYAVSTSTVAGGNWLSVNPAGGQVGSSPTVDVSVSPGSLAQGTYTGAVTVSGAFSNSPLTENVTFTVTSTSGPFNLIPAPPSFTFSSVNQVSPPAQSLTATTSTNSQVPFTVSASSAGNWLSVSPAAGTTGVTSITVSARPTKVPGPGVYTGSITLTATGASNSPLLVPATFNVTTVPRPSALTFAGRTAGANPPSQQLNVKATGPDVTYTDSASSTGNWLSVSPSGGTTNGPPLTVSVNTAGLSPNTYGGSITISAAGAANRPLSVLVTLRVLPAAFKPLYTFAGGADGQDPHANLLLNGGNLYGTTVLGGASNFGTAFEVNIQTGAPAVLHSFTGVPSDGSQPEAALIWDSAGNFYGSTSYGGGSNWGSVFQMHNGVVTLLHSFSGPDGASPCGAVVRDSAGNIYGTTYYGGPAWNGTASGNGTVFRLNTAGNLKTLHSFTGQPDGANPYAGLLSDNGNLFGTTVGGGAGYGTVFEVNARTGKTTVLYSFTGGADGGVPEAGLVSDGNGNLYGTTTGGGSGFGSGGFGVVFMLNISTGQESVLHSFAGPPSEGANPYASLVRDPAGNLYGSTSQGGASGYGTLFALDTAGNLITLYSFTGGADGANPYGGLVRDSKGNLYGAAEYGGLLFGSQGYGTIFKVIP